MGINEEHSNENYLLFRDFHGKGTSHYYLHLAEAQRQAEEWERYWEKKRRGWVGFRCALTGTCKWAF